MNELAGRFETPHDVRPLVRTAGYGNRSIWIFGAVLLVAALLLFQALNARRENLAVPQTQAVAAGGAMITAPPPLSLPPSYAEPAVEPWPIFRRSRVAPAASGPSLSQPQVVTRVVERPGPVQPQAAGLPTQPTFAQPQPSVVFGNAAPATPSSTPAASAPSSGQGSERVQAARLLNPGFTVPKGTVIAAVLETALDSSRAGAARAIVSRDVMGFDGARVLVPRGSRLYGEYASEATPGQKRALIRWQRLTRPDGVIVNLDSPSADPLGRAGIEGKVDSHFFARFGSAILQSVLDIGVGLATRSVSDDAVILALPGSTQQISAQVQQSQVQPTVRVRQGTSVSVFVARDLDFSTVDR